MQIDRRSFGRLGAGLFAGAMLARSGLGAAQEADTAPALTVAERLAPIAPELRPAARMMIESGFPPITEEVLRNMGANPGPPMPELLPNIPVAERDIEARGTLPPVKLFVINSEPTLARPAILHIHGGGHLVGSVRGELRNLQETAQALDCTIVSVEYRLAPAARYTESTEDTYAGLKWLFDNAPSLGVDPMRIALMGESAGGGHAAMLAIKARDRGEVPVLFQSLVYPMLDDRTGSSFAVPPHIATVGWSVPENRLGWRSFLGMEPGGADVPVAAVPARLSDLSGLPPAWIGVGAVDLFAAEDIEYARRLALAAVPVELLVTPGAFHGFDRAAADTVLAQTFTQSKLAALARAFSQG
tara:strand:- start:16490 stop:17563 length:1074 start_codon:yes stop_codon:yes gene_type:complete